MSNYKEIEKQISKIKSELENSPDDANLINDLGVGYFLLGQFSNSIIQLKKAVRLKSDNVNYHYNLANTYAENDQPQLAIDTYLKALDLNPAHIPSLNNLADSYEIMGDKEKAHDLFHYLIKVEPDNPLSHFNLGNFFLRQNQHIEAVKCYEEAIKRDENFTDAYYNISWVLFQAKVYREALSYSKKGLNLDPEHEELKNIKEEIEAILK